MFLQLNINILASFGRKRNIYWAVYFFIIHPNVDLSYERTGQFDALLVHTRGYYSTLYRLFFYSFIGADLRNHNKKNQKNVFDTEKIIASF